MSTISNPFQGVTIGSRVDMSGRFHGKILDPSAKITQTVSLSETEKSMSGQSDLVYTTSMNQGSMSFAGSYGVSGLSKLTAAVSAYAGQSSADNQKSVSVICEILKTAGAETILFEELSPSRMMSALMGAPHDSLKDVLTRYTALMEQVKGSSLIGILTDPDKNKQEYENVKEAYESWADAAKDFRALMERGW
jgi:hypothetical protein